jgi:hypothetical protein
MVEYESLSVPPKVSSSAYLPIIKISLCSWHLNKGKGSHSLHEPKPFIIDLTNVVLPEVGWPIMLIIK